MKVQIKQDGIMILVKITERDPFNVISVKLGLIQPPQMLKIKPSHVENVTISFTRNAPTGKTHGQTGGNNHGSVNNVY